MIAQKTYIVSDPAVRGGRPCLAGHRITVAEIALAYEGALGHWTITRIAEQFDLTLSEIHAALAYYFDHREEIDQSFRDDDRAAEELLKNIPSVREGVAQLQLAREKRSARNRPSSG